MTTEDARAALFTVLDDRVADLQEWEKALILQQLEQAGYEVTRFGEVARLVAALQGAERAGTSPAPPTCDLAAVADLLQSNELQVIFGWASDRAAKADEPMRTIAFDTMRNVDAAARELRADLRGAPTTKPTLPGTPLSSGFDYRPSADVPGAELSAEGQAEVEAKRASVEEARRRAMESGHEVIGGAPTTGRRCSTHESPMVDGVYCERVLAAPDGSTLDACAPACDTCGEGEREAAPGVIDRVNVYGADGSSWYRHTSCSARAHVDSHPRLMERLAESEAADRQSDPRADIVLSQLGRDRERSDTATAGLCTAPLMDGSDLTGGHRLRLLEPARPARDYQLVAADLTITTGRLLLTDAVGLGKSCTATLVLRAPDALPALVVTLTHLPQQWEREIHATLPELVVHTVRSGKPYDTSRSRGGPPDVLVMNYHKLAGWADHLRGTIRTVLFDEAQELRHNATRRYEAAEIIADGARYRMGLTATPIYNYGGEIYNVLSVLAPDALGTREEFLREWGADGSNFDSQTGKPMVKDPAALGSYLRDSALMLGRTRADVGRELPPVMHITQTVDADEDTLNDLAGNAVEMARLILDTATQRQERFQAAGEFDWMLRQATGIAKARYVAEFVRMLLQSEDRVVLFGWHRAVYDLWLTWLADYQPVLYTGTESPTRKNANARAFLEGDSRVLLMSLRAGAGLDGLQQRCRVAVFGELDWSPQVHHQCIGRLAHDGQTEPTLAYFLVSEYGADPTMAEVLQLKRSQSEPLVNPQGALLGDNQDATGDRVRQLARDVLERAGHRSR